MRLLPEHGEELDPRRGGLFGSLAPPFVRLRQGGGDDLRIDHPLPLRRLPESIAVRDERGLGGVAAEDDGMAEFAARQADRGAGDAGLAEIEGRAASADPPTHHDEANLRAAHCLCARRSGQVAVMQPLEGFEIERRQGVQCLFPSISAHLHLSS